MNRELGDKSLPLDIIQFKKLFVSILKACDEL